MCKMMCKLPVAREIVGLEIFIVEGRRIESDSQHDIVLICYCLFCIFIILFVVLFSLKILK